MHFFKGKQKIILFSKYKKKNGWESTASTFMGSDERNKGNRGFKFSALLLREICKLPIIIQIEQKWQI